MLGVYIALAAMAIYMAGGIAVGIIRKKISNRRRVNMTISSFTCDDVFKKAS